MDIGIDLGTTYSAVAVKGRVNFAPGYVTCDDCYYEECDVTIIPTPDGEKTVPSVFWADCADSTKILIGTEAKEKAREGEAPIAFSKRCIGTQQRLKIHDREYTAREVAAHTLRFLKRMAEQALGEPVERAVITHPAYFDPNQVQETLEAAKDAGFDMSLPEQMMMEPVAAALAYTVGVQQDPLRVLAYDLGGGTFDVSVLERNEGVISLKAFDGDHLLGGYNFDRALVNWLLSKLRSTGRVIPLDDNDPVQRGRRARLMQLAESTKFRLWEAKTDVAPVAIKAMDILYDDQGKPVQFSERINRKEYAELIKDELATTIACCHEALRKAGMRPDELDNILLVGGSTYGQWVINAVSAAFEINAEPFHPDLCVAMGAALRAANLPPPPPKSDKWLLNIEARSTNLPVTNVSGTVTTKDGTPPPISFRAILSSALSGETPPQALSSIGGFFFEDVPVQQHGKTDMSLRIVNGAGVQEVGQSFQIAWDPAPAQNIPTVLPKPLFVRAHGLHRIAAEGAQLPVQLDFELELLRKESSIDVPILQEDIEIGFIRVENIPDTVGKGCPVEVHLEITDTNEIRGLARVKDLQEIVVAQSRIRIVFPPIEIPSLDKLANDWNVLEARRSQLLALSHDPEERVRLGQKAKKLSDKISQKFKAENPDAQEIHRDLQDLNRLVNPPIEDLDPPRKQFLASISRCRSMLQKLGSDPQIQPFEDQLKLIEEDGRSAFESKNQKKWASASENLQSLEGRIEKTIDPPKAGGDEPDPTVEELKDYGLHIADGLRSSLAAERSKVQALPDYALKFKQRCDEIDQELDQMRSAILRIPDSLEFGRARAQLIQICFNKKSDLEERIRSIPEPAKKRGA